MNLFSSMLRGRSPKLIGTAGAVFLSAVFIYAGALKILDPSLFYRDIQSYRLLPDLAAWWMAHYLPWLEITLGLGILPSPTRLVAGRILGCLLIVFLMTLLSAWVRGLDISCGCFGGSLPGKQYAWWLLRDIALLFVLGWVLLLALLAERKKA